MRELRFSLAPNSDGSSLKTCYNGVRISHMKRKLTKIGNSWGLILPREVLDLLGVPEGSEVEVELAGNTLLVTAPGTDRDDVEAGVAYLGSKRERADLYRRLAE